MSIHKQGIYIRIGIVLILFLCLAYVFFPGSYSVDTWNMYSQMVDKNYNDWHAPVLSWGWRQLYLLTGKYYSLYCVQMVLYWLFVSMLLVRRDLRWREFGIGIALSVLFIFVPQYIMKDAHHAIAWGLAVVVMLRQHRIPARRLQILAVLFVFLLLIYGLYVRMNAVIALLPLLFAATWGVRGRMKQVMIVVAVMALILPAYNFFTYTVLSASRTFPGYKWKLLDIGGISKLSKENYFPASVTGYEHFDYDAFMQAYTPASIDDIYWPKDRSPSLLPQPNKHLYEDVSTQWTKAIAAHPFLYFQNRWQGFLHYLRIDPRYKLEEYWNIAFWTEPANPLGLTYNYDDPVRKAVLSGYKALREVHFFDPWLWLLLNTALAFLFYRAYRKGGQKDPVRYILCMLHLSAALYILSQFFIYQHDRDFRYNYYSVFSCFIGLMHTRYIKAGK